MKLFFPASGREENVFNSELAHLQHRFPIDRFSFAQHLSEFLSGLWFVCNVTLGQMIVSLSFAYGF